MWVEKKIRFRQFEWIKSIELALIHLESNKAAVLQGLEDDGLA